MNRHKLLLFSVLAGSVAFGGRASAQDVSAQPEPAHISVIDGAVTLIRDGRAEAASSNLPLLEGDRLRTDAGRLEVFMPDGSLLHLDQNTTADLLSGSLIRLISGRLIFVVSGRSDERLSVAYQIDAAAGSVRIVRPGDYRVSLVQGRPGPDVEVAVVRGEARLTTDRGSVGVGAGEFSTAAEGSSPADPETFNSARLDEFGRWSADRLEAHLGYASRQYLPPEVQVYSSTFDQYGMWEDVQPYGHVWYPSVDVGWRPYYDGYWRSVGPYGWTWIGNDPWCWPTHHYGRWGMGARGWFWIPGGSWGAAWVSWGIGAGYVGWCPLGWNNYAVVDLSFGVHWGSGYGHNPWSAWTVVPRRSFGGPGRVPAFALHGDALRAVERGGVAVQRNGPPTMGRATARPFGTTADVAAGRAVPRGGSSAVQGGGGGRPIAVPRASAGAAGTVAAFDRRGGAAARTPQSAASGIPPRDPRPSAFQRAQAPSSRPAPLAAERSDSAPIRTYERTQGAASDRQVRAPGMTANAESRSSGSLAEVAARTNAARRSADPAQRDDGSRVYNSAPEDYRRASPQALERGGGMQAIQRSPAQSWSQDPRSSSAAPAYERRVPEAVAAPRPTDRSWTTASRPIQAAPAYERRAPERAVSPQMSQPSRPDRASAPARAAAPARSSAPSAPQRAAPAGGQARGGAAGGIRRR